MTEERNEETKNEETAATPESESNVAVAEAPEPPAEGAPAPPEESPDALTVVEALLFASGKPVAIPALAEAAELPADAVTKAVDQLEERYAGAEHGVRLDRVAGGVRLVTRPEHDYAVRRLLGLDGKNKLSIAALETLAIIAYRQPVTAPEVAELRGVNSASSIRTLLDRKLITTAGRKEVVGTPFLYKTTKEFLVHFGLSEISEMPKPEELEALYGGEAATPDAAQQPLFSEDEMEGVAEGEPGMEGVEEASANTEGESAPLDEATLPLPDGETKEGE